MEKELGENVGSKKISYINAVTEVRKDVDLVQGGGCRDERVQPTKHSEKGMRWEGHALGGRQPACCSARF